MKKLNRTEIYSIIRPFIGDIPDDNMIMSAAGAIAQAMTGEPANGDALVVIANQGVHPIFQSRLPTGEVYYASRGNLPMESAEALQSALEAALVKTASKLKERDWRKVYLVPSGLPVLSIALAAMVYQIKAFPVVPVQYDRETGSYWPLTLEIRALAVQGK